MQRNLVSSSIKGMAILLVVNLIMILAIQSFVGVSRTYAATQAMYYVSETGSDSNPGTESQPFLTITKARDVVRTVNANMTGDIIVYLRGGTYTLSSTIELDVRDSGTNGFNIIYQAYPGETPVISGGVSIPNSEWSLYNPTLNIYEADVSPTLDSRQLYVNGVRAQRARGADNPSSFSNTHGVGYTLPTSGTYQNMATWTNLTSIEIVTNNLCNNYRGGIASISGGFIYMKQPYYQTASRFHNAYNVSWVENAFELLDSPGEFYLNSVTDKLYYIPRTGENLTTNAEVIVPAVENLIEGTGYSGTNKIRNIQFKGITFSYATWLGANTDLGFADGQSGVRRIPSATREPSLTAYSESPFSLDYITLNTTKLEAESASRLGDAIVSSDTNASGGSYVSNMIKVGDGVTFTAPNVVTTELTLRYATTVSGAVDLFINGVHERRIYIFTTGGLSGSWADKIETVSIPANAIVTIKQNNQDFMQVKTAAVKFAIADSIVIDSSVFQHLGGSGVVFTDGTSNSTVSGSRFEDISLNGIMFGDFGIGLGEDNYRIPTNMQATNIIVSNNYVSKVGQEYLSGIGIVGGYAKHSTITHNHLTNLPYMGISLGYGWGANDGTLGYASNNAITYNYVNDYMKVIPDGGGIYTQGKQSNSIIQYNYVANQHKDYSALYLDNGSGGITVSNNVVMNAPTFGFVTPVSPLAYNNNMSNNYANVPLFNISNHANGNVISNNVTTMEAWPLAAYNIIDGAGLQTAYSDLALGDSTINELKINQALNKAITSDVTLTNAVYATDGHKSNPSHSVDLAGTGLHWIQLDLGEAYNINKLKIWRDYGDGRTYHDVIMQVSNDSNFSTGVTTVFNNDTNNTAGQGTGTNAEYAETIDGKVVIFNPVKARYVRIWSNGNTVDGNNHYVEVEVGINPYLYVTTGNLSDLTWGSATTGWGTVQKNKSAGGNQLRLGNTFYTKGIGVHANSEIVYNLNGAYTNFSSDIGIAYEQIGVCSHSSVVFQVWGDGIKLFDSGTVTGASSIQHIDLDITSVNVLRLVVTDAGNGITCDHASWAGSHLTSASDYLSDLTWTSASTGWGTVQKDKSAGSTTLNLKGTNYMKGIGTHASSEIIYNVNSQYSSFVSDIGIDNAIAAVCSQSSVVFQVWGDGTKLYDSGVITRDSTVQHVSLDIVGVNSLKLVVTDAGNGTTCDHADWADAKVSKENFPNGLWKLNEGAGTTASDISGKSNNGTVHGATWTTGKSGGGLNFNGSSDYVSLNNPTSLDITGEITLAAWINTATDIGTSGMYNIISRGIHSSPDGEVYLRILGTSYQVGTWNGVAFPTVSYTIPSGDKGTWVHLAGVYDGTKWILYRNGTNVGQTTTTVGALPVATGWAIGARSTGTERFFKGAIDNVRIYDKALSPQQILDLYSNGQ